MLNKRKKELMLEKKRLKNQYNNNELNIVAQQLNIINLLDAKVKSLIKDNNKLNEDEVLINALNKVSKDLEKELSFANQDKIKNKDYINNLNIQVNELNKYKPSQLSDEEISQYLDYLIHNAEVKDKKLMSIISKELKGKADLSKVNKLFIEKLNNLK